MQSHNELAKTTSKLLMLLQQGAASWALALVWIPLRPR